MLDARMIEYALYFVSPNFNPSDCRRRKISVVSANIGCSVESEKKPVEDKYSRNNNMHPVYFASARIRLLKSYFIEIS